MGMISFEMHRFSTRPEKNGDYIVLNYDGSFATVGFTTEYGWNTHKFEDGSFSNKSVASDDEMQRWYKCWMSKYGIGSRNWYETLEVMTDEVRQELATRYADRVLTEEEKDAEGLMEDFYDSLEEAREMAEVFR